MTDNLNFPFECLEADTQAKSNYTRQNIDIMKTNIFLFCLGFFFLVGCNFDKEKLPFEGEINIAHSRGLYGPLFKTHTKYIFSKNRVKREEKLGGLNSIYNTHAGIIIDLEKDSVLLYLCELEGYEGLEKSIKEKIEKGLKENLGLNDTPDFSKWVKNVKHKLSIADYQKYLADKPFHHGMPHPIDLSFTYLDKKEYVNPKIVKDSMNIQGFSCDYTQYKGELFQHKIFDTKEINIDRKILNMLFVNLPKEINFPINYQHTTILTEISNEDIITGKYGKGIDALYRYTKAEGDTTKMEEASDLTSIAKNKFLNLGINLFKKGVDLNLHITGEAGDIVEKPIKGSLTAFSSVPNIDSFEEIDDTKAFFTLLQASSTDD